MPLKVYSYLRFSDAKQASGHSAERQTEYARQWAAARGLALDDSLSMRDEGLSAYHQRHVKHGALGAFLRAIDNGQIEPGSVLIVEGLDRLSRAEPLKAQAQLTQIIHAGIIVVTAADGQEYSLDAIRANPYKLIHSLVVMIRAHEESDTKSKRVKAAIRRQCDGWMAGTYRGPIRNGKDPQWLRWADGAWQIIPERAEAVLAILQQYRAGRGHTRLARALREQGLAVSDAGVYSKQVYRIVRNRALVGAKTIEVDGQEYRLEGYYPPLIDEGEFAALQTLADARWRNRGHGEIPGVLTGTGICVCGYCGAAIVGQNLMGRKRKADGSLQDGHRRLICCAASAGDRCPVGGSCSAVPVERAIMTWCADQMNLAALLEGEPRANAAQARLARAKQRAADIEQQQSKLMDAMLMAGDRPPDLFVRKAHELEDAAREAAVEVDLAERGLLLGARRDTPKLADAWRALTEGVLAMDTDARMKARRLVAETFERIVVCHLGYPARASRGGPIDVLLVARSGGSRMLSIHRRTGEVIQSMDFAQDLPDAEPFDLADPAGG